MVDCSGIIYAYQIREESHAKSLLPIRLDSDGLPTSGITANGEALAQIAASMKSGDLTWVHLDINDASSKKWVDAELTNALSDNMNKNLYLLSVIAAVFLPLGFLTGLLDINVGGLAGVDNPSAF